MKGIGLHGLLNEAFIRQAMEERASEPEVDLNELLSAAQDIPDIEAATRKVEKGVRRNKGQAFMEEWGGWSN